MARFVFAVVLVGSLWAGLVPARAQGPIALLGEQSGNGCGPTGGSGSGSGAAKTQADRAAATSRFLELVRLGEESLTAWLRKRAVERKDPSLQRALACFDQALELRERARIRQSDVGAALNRPDLDLALAHFYLGNRKTALKHLARPLAQRVWANAAWTDAERIRAQSLKARHLRDRLVEPFLEAVTPVAQKESNTCGSTAVHAALRGIGIPTPLDRLEDRRALHAGELDRIAEYGVAVAEASGYALDAAWTERPRSGDPEIGFPSAMTLEGVRDVLSRSYPVVLAVIGYVKPESGAAAWASGHYVTVVGVKCDAASRVTHIFTVDSDGGVHRRFERAELETIWRANTLGAIVLTPRSPARRFRARVGVSGIRDGEAAMRRWVGAAVGQRAD